MMHRFIKLGIAVTAALLLCGCGNMNEDLAYIKEHAGQIGDLLGQVGEKIAEDPDEFFGGDETSEQDLFLEPLLEKTWTLCAIEDEYGYNDQIFEDENKQFLLVEEWVQLQFPGTTGVGVSTGEVILAYAYGDNAYERHSFQFQRTDEGVTLNYLWPDYDMYGQDPDYNEWESAHGESEDWPFALPLQEWWMLCYDTDREMIKIARTRIGEEEPYMYWYLEGTSWYQ